MRNLIKSTHSAETINTWPNAEMVPFQKLEEVHASGNSWSSDTYALQLTSAGLTVSDFHPGDQGELHYAAIGKHPLYGDIATFYSARGPGEGARPRPAYFVYTGKTKAEPVKDPDVSREPGFLTLTLADEKNIAGRS